ncbi:MAG: transcription factor WhiB [Acidimicrobiaceae bacterium]|nr:transcription factor WhiB [Acidimicrobiaceae bacterium]
MVKGNCAHRDPQIFFPSDGIGVAKAKNICSSCPVQEACLEHALTHRIDHGVWGGCSERQRRKIRKQRKLDAVLTSVAVTN